MCLSVRVSVCVDMLAKGVSTKSGAKESQPQSGTAQASTGQDYCARTTSS